MHMHFLFFSVLHAFQLKLSMTKLTYEERICSMHKILSLLLYLWYGELMVRVLIGL
jgi:hypothetical protein